MTVLKTGSVLTTGGNPGDTAPGLTITVNPGAGAGQSVFGTVDYLNAPIWVVPPKTGNGQIAVYGDYLRAFPGLAAAIAGAGVGFDSGSPNGRNPAPLQFPEGTTGPGMREWSGTGAPSASTIGGAASLGDVYHRRDGSPGTLIYRCTAPGTPGTWTAFA